MCALTCYFPFSVTDSKTNEITIVSAVLTFTGEPEGLRTFDMVRVVPNAYHRIPLYSLPLCLVVKGIRIVVDLSEKFTMINDKSTQT